MNIAEWLIVAATIAGPVIAVQTQKFIERATERSRRRQWIFETLMATRATHLAPDRVRALNMIDLEFQPGRFSASKDREVVEAWRSLFGELNQNLKDAAPPAILQWNMRCDDFGVTLLKKMSQALGHDFSEEQLRRGIYHPQAHADQELSQRAILADLREILAGQKPLCMRVVEFPSSPEINHAQLEMLQRSAAAYNKDGALRVEIEAPPAERIGKGKR